VRLLSFLALLVAVGCSGVRVESFEEREAMSSPLMDDFASYASFDEIRQRNLGEVDWKVAHESKGPARDGVPRYDTLSVAISGYAYRGQVGDVVLGFLNDRLATVLFFPQDADACLAALNRSGLGVQFREAGDAGDTAVPPYTRLWCTRDWQGRVYIGWEDTRLAAQMKWWIERYA
jgi:hypothetical protein